VEAKNRELEAELKEGKTSERVTRTTRCGTGRTDDATTRGKTTVAIPR